MGTPNENHWAEAMKLEYFKPTFPKWKGIPLEDHTKFLDGTGIDLLNNLVALEPKKRISARTALKHVSIIL